MEKIHEGQTGVFRDNYNRVHLVRMVEIKEYGDIVEACFIDAEKRTYEEYLVEKKKTLPAYIGGSNTSYILNTLLKTGKLEIRNIDSLLKPQLPEDKAPGKQVTITSVSDNYSELMRNWKAQVAGSKGKKSTHGRR